METIQISQIVKDTYTNSSGYTLYTVVYNIISKGNTVILSFKDSTPTSSSFLNSSLGELIDNFGFEKFKKQVKITDLNKSQLGILKRYFDSCSSVN